jgi:hypothetical protein
LPGSPEEGRVQGYLRAYHYLGLRVVGENLQYLVQTRDGQDVACLLFGAAAWQCAARDTFIGWTAAQRAEGLSAVVNNTRFLILPWVKVPDLAVIFHEPVTPLSTRPVEGVKWGLDGGFFKIAVAPRPLGGFRTSNPSFLGHF